jgi:beta-glucosidase
VAAGPRGGTLSGPSSGDVFVPPGFVLGAATSAYQVEGGVDVDGRGPSIWDAFCALPGRITGGDDGRVACDHRRLWRSDVELIAGLGLDAYRFSLSWPRVQSMGRGPANQPGLDFYRSIVDALLVRGVEPFVTLYHWDLPQPLEEAGGWPQRDTAARFADYAALVGAALGDRVRHWSTVNEPWCAAMLGYAAGVHAPGRVDAGAAVAAAHGLAVAALRAEVRADAELAITLNPYPVVAAGDSDADRDAARRVDGVANRLWYDALLRGRYPDDVLADFAAVSDLGHIRDGDLPVISAPLDALGVNYYRRHHVRFGAARSAVPPWCTWPGSPDVDLVVPDAPLTGLGWAVEPDGLGETLRRLTAEYTPPPLYVHETGAAYPDCLPPGGVVQDTARRVFLDAHLRAALDARRSGIDLRGFFVWSLLDNFEWAHGYAPTFGLVAVDRTIQARAPSRARPAGRGRPGQRAPLTGSGTGPAA